MSSANTLHHHFEQESNMALLHHQIVCGPDDLCIRQKKPLLPTTWCIPTHFAVNVSMLLFLQRWVKQFAQLTCPSGAATDASLLFAGPMIRIIGDRLSGEIKAALLHTIGLLIAKAGPGLKPFVPQLQTTFLKCLGDQVC